MIRIEYRDIGRLIQVCWLTEGGHVVTEFFLSKGEWELFLSLLKPSLRLELVELT